VAHVLLPHRGAVEENDDVPMPDCVAALPASSLVGLHPLRRHGLGRSKLVRIGLFGHKPNHRERRVWFVYGKVVAAYRPDVRCLRARIDNAASIAVARSVVRDLDPVIGILVLAEVEDLAKGHGPATLVGIGDALAKG
jgi:hypothetical protein